MKSFIVTGHGRSGTRFLAKTLDRAKDWNVAHEPNQDMHLESVSGRFEERLRSDQWEGYGECNSFLLYTFRHIAVDRRAIIVRDPHEIAVSMANVGHAPNAVFADHLASSLAIIDDALEADSSTKLIRFDQMTCHGDYLLTVAKWLGVRLDAAELCFNKDNSAGRDRVVSFGDFDTYTRDLIERPCRWFRQKYGWAFGHRPFNDRELEKDAGAR